MPEATERQVEAFASRVGASLVSAAGVPELVCQNLEAYESKAFGLVGDPPLFDTERFARDLEAAYEAMWDLHARGRTPEVISLAE